MQTVSMPSDLHARSTRSAISPRFAMRTRLNMGSGDLDVVEGLAVLDGLAVRGEALHDLALHLGPDLVHDLHGLDDAEDGVLLNLVALLDEGGRVRAGRAIERADHGRLYDLDARG